MNMIISDNDKKILSLLIALLVAIVFIFLIIRPLAITNNKLKQEAAKTKEQANEMNEKAGLTDNMLEQEKNMSGQVEQVLSRFYPMLESQEAEYMATTLLLNHHLDIQSMSVTMPDTPSTLDWYQYSAKAEEKEEQTAPEQADAKEEQAEPFQLYTVRITCVADGDAANLWGLLDEISQNYPAISIAGLDCTTIERTVEVKASENQDQDEPNTAPATIKTNRYTMSLDIFMSEH